MELSSIARTSVKWSFASQSGRQVLQIIATLVLARLLSPPDFGLMGMAMVVVGFVSIFKDLGTSASLIQKKSLTEKLVFSVFWINIIFGLLISIIIFFSAPFIADFFNEARLLPIMRLLSLIFFISSFGITPQALLERNLDFHKLAKLELFATFAGVSLGIVLAIKGVGVWSLVWQSLATACISSVLLLNSATGLKRSGQFDWKEVKAVAGYSLNLSGFNISNYFVRNADYLLIGKFLGAEQLGYYTLAYRIMLYPLQNVTAVVSRVMFPLYSKIHEDDARFRSVYLRVAGIIAMITFPMMMGVMGVSKYFVLAFFGQKWAPVAILLIIFSPVGLLQSVDATTGAIYQAKARTDWMFRWGLASGAISVLGFSIGLRWGIIGVATSYLISTFLLAYPGLAIPFRLIDLKVSVLIKSLWRTLVCSILMLAIVYGAGVAFQLRLPDMGMLFVLFFIGVVSYGGISMTLNRDRIEDVLGLLRGSSA